MVEGKVIELTDEEQLQAIADASEATAGLPTVQEHLRTALDRLADRPEPDYRNAVKEAICAVETLVGIIAESPGVTLTEALKRIETRKLLPVHSALLKSWVIFEPGRGAARAHPRMGACRLSGDGASTAAAG